MFSHAGTFEGESTFIGGQRAALVNKAAATDTLANQMASLLATTVLFRSAAMCASTCAVGSEWRGHPAWVASEAFFVVHRERDLLLRFPRAFKCPDQVQFFLDLCR